MRRPAAGGLGHLDLRQDVIEVDAVEMHSDALARIGGKRRGAVSVAGAGPVALTTLILKSVVVVSTAIGTAAGRPGSRRYRTPTSGP